MKVAYFSNQFADAQGHGNTRYARELFRAFTDRRCAPDLQPVAAWSSMDAQSLAAHQKQTGLQLLTLGRRLTPLCWTFLNAPTIEQLLHQEIDLVHAVSLGYPVATHKPLVVTIHDLGPLTHPQYFQRAAPWIMRRSLERAIRKAAAFICVSRATADELLRVGGTQLTPRVHVVPEGVGEKFFEAADENALQSLNLPLNGSPYILAAGKISPRKNLPAVIRAFTEVAHKIPHQLVLVGGDGWQVDETYQSVLASGHAKRIHFPGFVSEQQLRRLYQGASAYIHPSLYEGFGLTVLEAMASGCPVITSNRASIPEVAGNAALLLDPDNSADIASALERVCSDEQLAADLSARGRDRATQFTWSRCAELTLDVYQQVLS